MHEKKATYKQRHTNDEENQSVLSSRLILSNGPYKVWASHFLPEHGNGSNSLECGATYKI
jgi:hypothetical protein